MKKKMQDGKKTFEVFVRLGSVTVKCSLLFTHAILVFSCPQTRHSRVPTLGEAVLAAWELERA